MKAIIWVVCSFIYIAGFWAGIVAVSDKPLEIKIFVFAFFFAMVGLLTNGIIKLVKANTELELTKKRLAELTK